MYNEENFKEVIASYTDMVTRIACLNLHNLSDVSDVVQEVFIKIYQKAPDFASTEHEKAWIIRVTINLCRNYNQSFWRKNVDCNDELYMNASINEADGEVLSMVRALPHPYSIVIYLHYYEGYSAEEIGVILHKRTNTIYSLLSRARKKLKIELDNN